MKKICGKIAMLSAALLLLVGVSGASAASKPSISSIGNRSANSVTLKLLYVKYKSKNVDIEVQVRNKDTDKVETKSFDDQKLDSKGKRSVKIEDLLSGTKYSFKVRIKKHDGSTGFSNWSGSLSAKTKS